MLLSHSHFSYADMDICSTFKATIGRYLLILDKRLQLIIVQSETFNP